MRRLLATWIMAVTLLCFVLAPVVVAAPHGPAVAAEAAEVIARHSHGDLNQSGGHDGTDNGHQLSASCRRAPILHRFRAATRN